MKSTFFHVSLVVIGLVLIAFATTNFTALQMISQQIAERELAPLEIAENGDVVEETNEEPVEDEFASFLSKREHYDLPFGAAEIEGYLTTVERDTSLDRSTPTVTCAAFVVTDGPEILMNALEGKLYGTPPTAVIGSENFGFGKAMNNSAKENPVRVLVTLNPVFEGELIGCMSWPFSSIIEIE
ncbi:MAG: hypothetical protein NUV84_03630 [Candidatus Uhrbacteria bacterium]|nr:hypothetical protein [Candidatus Uhrbacteria bacterium]